MRTKFPEYLIVLLFLFVIVSISPAEERAGNRVEKLSLLIKAEPEQKTVYFTAEYHLIGTKKIKNLSGYLTGPAEITDVYLSGSGKKTDFALNKISSRHDELGIKGISVTLPDPALETFITFEYSYTEKEFFASYLNPSTWDDLYFGQIKETSIYNTHNYIYPVFTRFGEPQNAEIRFDLPTGWTGVTVGKHESKVTVNERDQFFYSIDFASNIVPYPIAIYPYLKISGNYKNRIPIDIYCAEKDREHAQEKIGFMSMTVFPFLENLMGNYPFDSLTIIEVFPWSGNTGMAAASGIVLSQNLWFAEPINDDYRSMQAQVLVDESAHQWNFHKVQYPNYLSEGISTYTDTLFSEYMGGPAVREQQISHFKSAYKKIVEDMDAIRKLRNTGLTLEEVSRKSALSQQEIQAYWSFTDKGELPISDPEVFNSLYFLKGAVALDTLRDLLGDDNFYTGFRQVFSDLPAGKTADLDHFRDCFEQASGRNLESFFHYWFYETGMK
jgi:hypothetical protein